MISGFGRSPVWRRVHRLASGDDALRVMAIKIAATV